MRFQYVFGLSCLLISLNGCAERLLQIRSDPPGATVVINGETILVEREGQLEPAKTPVDIPFDHYSRFEITLRHPEALSSFKTIDLEAPWTSYPPIDLFAELLFPWWVSERHEIQFQLDPIPEPDDQDDDKILARMRDLQERIQNGTSQDDQP